MIKRFNTDLPNVEDGRSHCRPSAPSNWELRNKINELIDEVNRLTKESEKVSKEETVTILKSEYEKLVKDSDFLSCLEAAGVDNWHGYSIAWGMMDEEEED